MIEIRKAKKEDIKELIKLDKISNKEIKWWYPLTSSEFSKLINQDLVYLAEQNKEIIAYLNGDVRDKELFLDNIYVKKSERGKNLAQKLIKKFLSDFKNKFNEIRLECPRRLERFYEKFGFKTTALIMKRRLK